MDSASMSGVWAGSDGAATHAPAAAIGPNGQCGIFGPSLWPRPDSSECARAMAAEQSIPESLMLIEAAASAPTAGAHDDAHAVSTPERTRAKSANSAARKRKRSFIRSNLILQATDGNPSGFFGQGGKQLYGAGLAGNMLALNSPLFPYRGTDID